MSKNLVLLFCVMWSAYTPLQGGWTEFLDHWARNLTPQQVAANAVPVTLGAVGLVYGIHLLARESNSTKIKKAQQFIQAFQEQVRPKLLAVKDLSGLQGLLANFSDERFTTFQAQAKQSHDELQARCARWYEPFNRTQSMKQAHLAMQQVHETTAVASIMQKYKIFILAEPTASISDLLRQHRQGDSDYPWYVTADQLEKDIAKIQTIQHEKFECYSVLFKHLGSVLQTIRQSEEYGKEKREIQDLQCQKRPTTVQELQVQLEQAKLKILNERNGIAQRDSELRQKAHAENLALAQQRLQFEQQKFEWEKQEKAKEQAAADFQAPKTSG